MPPNPLGLQLICGTPGCRVAPGLCSHISTPDSIVHALEEDTALIGKALQRLEDNGLEGERTNALALILALVSRHLERPLNALVYGTSSSGKSYLVRKVIGLFPSDAVHQLTASSERALVYSDTDFRHKIIFLHEAAGISGAIGSSILRSIIWDGRLQYETVEKTKEGFRPRRIEKDGPTGLITKSTHLLEEETSTRVLTLYVRDDERQTRAVLRRTAEAGSTKRLRPNDAKWRRLFASLPADATVDVPFAVWLADRVPADRVRARRDFPQLLTAIKASALLHHRQRRRTTDGAIEANALDYAIACAALGATLVAAASGSLTKTQAEAVDAVAAICDEKAWSGRASEANVTEVAVRLGIDVSSAWRRLAPALREGYVVNLETRPRRMARLTPGQAPRTGQALPTVNELARAFRHLLPAKASTATNANVQTGQPSASVANVGHGLQSGMQSRVQSQVQTGIEYDTNAGFAVCTGDTSYDPWATETGPEGGDEQ